MTVALNSDGSSALARNGFRVGRRLPIAVVGETYGLITVLDRVEPDIRGDGVPARYEVRCRVCGAVLEAKGSDVVRRYKWVCHQPPRRQPRRQPRGRKIWT